MKTSLLALVSGALLVAARALPAGLNRSKNVILMISDGHGPAGESLARIFFTARDALPPEWRSPLGKIIIGNVHTRSADNWVTDSAASATAYACNTKSFNHAIGVNSNNENCATVLEAAKVHGLATGLVTVTRITHATPASFSAHVPERDWEALIAAQQIGDNPTGGRMIDVLFGGGRMFFYPNTTEGSKRTDGRDLFDEARTKYDWKTVVLDGADFDAIPADASAVPALACLADDHMEYEIDRAGSGQPSLAEMTAKALGILKDAGSDRGFFLMVEGGRIDHAAHINDPAGLVHDIKAYWDALEIVRKFADENPDTLVLHVSDHETGGLALARQLTSTQSGGSTVTKDYAYQLHPEVLLPVTASAEKLARMIRQSAAAGATDKRLVAYVTYLVQKYYGVHDVTTEEAQKVVAAFRREANSMQFTEWALSEILNFRVQLGWSTHGHTGADVLFGVYQKSSQTTFHGDYDNTDVSQIMREHLALNMTKVTFSYLPPPAPSPLPAKLYIDSVDLPQNEPGKYSSHN